MAELKANFVIGNLNKLKQQLNNITVGGKTTASAKSDTEQKKQTKGIFSMGAAIGGVAGLVGGLIKSSSSIQSILKFIGATIDSLVGPFVPILIGLLKPFLSFMLFISNLLFQFLQNPAKGFKDALDGLITAIKSLLGGGEGAKTTVKGAGAVAGAGIGAAIAGPIGALVGAIIGPLIASLAASLGEIFGQILIAFDAFTGGAITNIFEGIVNIFRGVYDFIAGFFSLDFERAILGLVDILQGIWQLLLGTVQASFAPLKAFLIGTWVILKNLLLGLWSLLKFIVVSSFDFLKNLLTNLWNLLKDVFVSSFDALRNIGTFIKDKILDFFSFGGGGRGNSIGDGIVTPQGNIIKTDPRDYIIATTNPGALGGSGSMNVTINVQGNADSKTIKEITRQMSMLLKRQGAL